MAITFRFVYVYYFHALSLPFSPIPIPTLFTMGVVYFIVYDPHLGITLLVSNEELII